MASWALEPQKNDFFKASRMFLNGGPLMSTPTGSVEPLLGLWIEQMHAFRGDADPDRHTGPQRKPLERQDLESVAGQADVDEGAQPHRLDQLHLSRQAAAGVHDEIEML